MSDSPFPVTYPKWLSAYCQRWITRLGLKEWEINFSLKAVMDATTCDGAAEAHCEQWALLNKCNVAFRSDIDDNESWRITVIHELLHVKHTRVDRFLENVVFPETGPLTCDAVKRGYGDTYESFIHGLATSLYRAFEDIDYPVVKAPKVETKPVAKKRGK